MADCNNTNNNSHICIHSADIQQLKQDSERNSTQHREFYDKFNDLTTKQAIADERYNNILAVQNDIKSTVTELKEKPAKRWDNISLTVITTIISLIIGGIIGSFIP